MGPILHHMLILFGFMVDLRVKVCRLQLLMHLDIVGFLRYLISTLASLRPVHICIANKPVLFVLFLSLGTGVDSGLKYHPCLNNIRRDIVQKVDLGQIGANPLVNRIHVLLSEESILTFITGLRLNLCCIKLSTRHGLNPHLDLFFSFVVDRVADCLIFRQEDYTVVLAHLYISNIPIAILIVERDCHGLIERAEMVWLRVCVRGVQCIRGLRE